MITMKAKAKKRLKEYNQLLGIKAEHIHTDKDVCNPCMCGCKDLALVISYNIRRDCNEECIVCLECGTTTGSWDIFNLWNFAMEKCKRSKKHKTKKKKTKKKKTKKKKK